MGGPEGEWLGDGQEMARTDMRSTSVAVSDTHYTETAPQASKEPVKKGVFFTPCGKCAGESPQVLTGQFPKRLASLIACLLYFFLAVLTLHYKQVFSLGGSY